MSIQTTRLWDMASGIVAPGRHTSVGEIPCCSSARTT